MVNLRLWIPQSNRSSTRAMNELRIRSAEGHWVPLKKIAEITTEVGQVQIKQDNLKRMVAVTGRISGRDMGLTVADVIKAMDQPGLLPHKAYYIYTNISMWLYR
ncbi:MAG: efflux RND transporter permease subunit [Methylomonas sp.]|jgi:Cu/Ag efflux pump CusA|nr:efflux RND transporter permease subunit [Methylomonas sp.]